MDYIAKISIKINNQTTVMVGLTAQSWLDAVDDYITSCWEIGKSSPHFKWSSTPQNDCDQILLVYKSGKRQYLHGSEAKQWIECVNVVHECN